MRILIYVEPHPIRNSMTHFVDVAKRFLPVLPVAAGEGMEAADIRLYANRQTIDALGEQPNHIKQQIINPTGDEQNLFDSHLQNWDAGGIGAWSELLTAGAVSDAYVDVLDAIRARYRFDVIVHWGENGAIERYVKERSVRRVAVELGCTRPPFMPSMVYDPLGTNGAAAPAQLTIEAVKEIVGGKEMRAGYAQLAFGESLESMGFEESFTPLNFMDADRIVTARSNRKIAFLPLQLYDDANLLKFSRYGRLVDFVSDVVPKLDEAGYLSVIKPHPASRHRPNCLSENEAARRFCRDYDVVWLDPAAGNVSSARLFSASDLVVAVNSSVGFEATLFDKDVVVAGQAIYKPEGLFPTLADALSENFDRQAYQRGLGYLRECFLNAYLAYDAGVQTRPAFLLRVQQAISTPDNPYKVLEGVYKAIAPTQSQRRKCVALHGVSSAGITDPRTPVFKAKPANAAEDAQLPQGLKLSAPEILAALAPIARCESATDLSAWLDANWRKLDVRRKVIDALNLFDEDFYLKCNPDVAASQMNGMRHFLRFGEREGRSPRPEIDLLAAINDRSLGPFPLLSLVREALRQSPLLASNSLPQSDKQKIEHAKRALSAVAHAPKAKIAVVYHAYYADLVDELIADLKNIREPFDLYVSLPAVGGEVLKRRILNQIENAIFFELPNRGRDIAPFLVALPFLLKRDYLAVLKLHAKKGYFAAGKMNYAMGEAWRRSVAECLIGSPERVDAIVAAFENDATLSLVGPAHLLVNYSEYPAEGFASTVAAVSPARAFRPTDRFFAGTMFWMRPKAFARLKHQRLSFESFGAEDGLNDGALAHVIERLFGQLAELQNCRLGAVDLNLAAHQVALSPSAIAEKIPAVLSRITAQREIGARGG